MERNGAATRSQHSADDAPSSTTTTVRVVIVGGGLAGATLAAALGSAGVATVLLDRESTDHLHNPDYDIRTTAVALASRRVLERAGVWDGLTDVASPILDILITDKGSPVELHFDHNEVGDEPFGHIVDNRLLRLALMARLSALPAVDVHAPARVTGIDRSAGLAQVRLDDGTSYRCELVVGADGRGSTVREAAEIGTVRWPYRQSALACCFRHEEPHNGVALEHFQPTGPFAVLPMVDDADGSPRSSLVWSEQPARADALVAMPDKAFERILTENLDGYLGQVSVIGRRRAYPLSVLYAKRYTDNRIALISEAAHAVHPIAGQGLNMGFRDIASLSEIIVDRARLGLDIGDPEGLAAYQRQRHFDNATMVAVTDGLTRLFSTGFPPIRLTRDLGLSAVGALPPVKRFFMRHAMGMVGSLPRTIRGEAL